MPNYPSTALDNYEQRSRKGQPGGYASLGPDGKVPSSQGGTGGSGGGGGVTPATSVVSEITPGQSPAVGTSILYARADHTHGTPGTGAGSTVYNVVAVGGAIGDGITDDSTAVANTYAAIPAAGGTLFFPPGQTFIVNTMTLNKPGITVQISDSTIVKLKSQSGGAQTPLFNITASNMRIMGGTLDGNSGGISAGTGNYWNGLIQMTGGCSDVQIRNVKIQNTARGGIYVNDATLTFPRIVIDQCDFTGIGLGGAGNGGACIMFDGGVIDSRITKCHAYGRLSSNFLKMKVNNNGNCVGNEIDSNHLDYRTNTTFDGTNSCLGIEMWNGSWGTRCHHNHVYGPNTVPTTGAFWGISCGDARGSVVDSNVVIGSSTNIQAMTYGIEVGECPSLVVSNNQVSWCTFGSNATNNNPLPSHSINFTGNTWQNCFTNGVVIDSAPSGVKFNGDTFIDCGQAYIFFNSFNTGGGDGTIKDAVISACSFQIQNQTRLHPEGSIFGIYILGLDSTKIARVTVANCNFGPYPGGTSTVGLVPIEINNPRGVKMHHCNFDGARPSDLTAQASRAIVGFCSDLHVDHCTAVNFSTDFAFTNPQVAGPLSTFEFNSIGTLLIQGSTANGPNVVTYWDLPTGTMHVRQQNGVDFAVGTGAGGTGATYG